MSTTTLVGETDRITEKVEKSCNANDEDGEQNSDDDADGDVQIVRSIAVVLSFSKDVSVWPPFVFDGGRPEEM